MATSKRPIHMGQEKFWKEQFTRAAKSAVTWQLSAAELRCAADILHTEIKKDLRRMKKGQPGAPMSASVWMMLCGLMLENLFKAVLVSSRGALDKKGRFAHKSHNLLALADLVNLKLSDDEAFLLERLTNYVEWVGKYPIPLVYQALLPRIHPSGGFGPASISKFGTGGDIRVINQIAQRIIGKLPVRERVPLSRMTRSGQSKRARQTLKARIGTD